VSHIFLKDFLIKELTCLSICDRLRWSKTKRRREREERVSTNEGGRTLAEIIIYKIKIVCCFTIVVGTLGYLPALHTNGSAMIMQGRNRKRYIPTKTKS
jgi:hypothetical protein